MGSVKYVLLAGAAAVMSTAAVAADLPPIAPPIVQPVPVEEFASGWYLRGDIGMSNQKVKSLFNKLYETTSSVQHEGIGFDSAPTFGVGLGYQVNNWFRVDVTGEYRAPATFTGSDNVRFVDQFGGTAAFVDNYVARKSEWVVLANAYLDLGTWWCITPFIGGGIGMANVNISGFRDDALGFLSDGTPIIGTAFGPEANKWNFAWAVHAGLAYKATPGLTIELAYRYLSMGDGTTGDIRDFLGRNSVVNPMEFRDLTSHDIKLGVRWMLDTPARPMPVYEPPLMRKG